MSSSKKWFAYQDKLGWYRFMSIKELDNPLIKNMDPKSIEMVIRDKYKNVVMYDNFWDAEQYAYRLNLAKINKVDTNIFSKQPEALAEGKPDEEVRNIKED